jgi:hypothetical protein
MESTGKNKSQFLDRYVCYDNSAVGLLFMAVFYQRHFAKNETKKKAELLFLKASLKK